MNPIVFALRHPITMLVGVVALVAAGGIAVYGPDATKRMKVDIFPRLNLPIIYVAQPYGGMDPAQMEGLLTNYYEYHFLYIGGIHHVESKNIQGVALMKLFFHPGTDMAQAMAETINYVNRSRAFMPPGTVAPFVMRFDTGSVPVGFLVLSSDTKTVDEIADQALFKVRPQFAKIDGVSAPPPFGGPARTVVVRADPDRLKAYQLSPDDLVKALSAGNVISPSGAIRVQEQMPLVPVNSMVVKPKELGKIPVRVGTNKYIMLEDVVTRDPLTKEPLIEDAFDIPSGYALVNGRRAVYIPVIKRATHSTLSVVNAVKENLPKMKEGLPPDIDVKFEFDQSPYITNAVKDVLFEAGLGAVLTGLMVLVFLRDPRSVIIVVLNIPLALTGSVVALWLTGQTINLMTLGGLALAVGILVDEATVEVENIHTQMDHTPSVALAVRRGNAETAVPRFLAMLCILAVFLPSFLMQEPARALFVPLSLAVGFAMITSYLLSSTLVPVLSVWLLKTSHRPTPANPVTPTHVPPKRRFSMSGLFGQIVGGLTTVRWLLIPTYFVTAAAVIFFVGSYLGREIFPRVDYHQFQLRLRAPTGTRIEQTEEITREALAIIRQEAGPDNVAITLGYVGLIPSSYPINTVFHWSGGPEEVVLRVSLKAGSGVRTEELKSRLREKLSTHLKEWMAKKWTAEGVPADRVAARVQELRLSFEPGDIVNDVMSFGSPTPVEVVVSGNNFEANRAFAETVRTELARVDSVRDLQVAQAMDYPTVRVTIDREKAGRQGVTAEEIARALLAATSSSRFVVPNYWRDPVMGIGYQVQVEIPQVRMNSADEVKMIPIRRTENGMIWLRDIADVVGDTMPGEFDRYNMARYVSLTANIEGEDLGRSVAKVDAIVKALSKKTPAGVSVALRGQAVPLADLFGGLRTGLLMAVAAIFLLLTAYFQSPRLALVAVASVPAVLAGVVVMLLITGTTINLQSFMGSIMAVGVAVSNAILLVAFADKHLKEGMSAKDAAVAGVRGRVRPILMTGCAMIAGMVPMALGLGAGGEQTAPLARAVIGGLLASMAATLFVLPAVFAWLMGRWTVKSVSLDPADPDGPHFVNEGVT